MASKRKHEDEKNSPTRHRHMHLLPKDSLTMPWWQCQQASTPHTLSGPENRPLVMLHLESPFQIASLLSALVVFSFPVNTSNFSYSKKAEPSQLMFWIASTNIPWAFIVGWHMQNCFLLSSFFSFQNATN